MDVSYLRPTPLKPLLKWPGGKKSEFRNLRSNSPSIFPRKIDRYFEPFLGGGAVWLGITPTTEMLVNDLSPDLIGFYEMIQTGNDDFFKSLEKFRRAWHALHSISAECQTDLYEGRAETLANYKPVIDALSLGGESPYDVILKTIKEKVKRIKRVEAKKESPLSPEDLLANTEGAAKAGYYTYVRDVYNSGPPQPLRAATFYFLRDYCFSSMFRFSKDGRFNVPYGGISYNNKLPTHRVPHWRSGPLRDHLESTAFSCLDFEDFLDETRPMPGDFIFIDPPYDSRFSTYDRNAFTEADQRRLADYLIHKTDAQFLAVMKHTDIVAGLYVGHEGSGVLTQTFDTSYTVSFRNRNDRDARHLVVYRTSETRLDTRLVG